MILSIPDKTGQLRAGEGLLEMRLPCREDTCLHLAYTKLLFTCTILIMPELPEVETIRAGLAQLLPGKRITGVHFDWPKSFPNTQLDVDRFLVGAQIIRIKRRAKVLLIELDTGYTLLIHLKMTGQLVYGRVRPLPKISHHFLAPPSNEKEKTGTYTLEERFGAGHPTDSLVRELPDKSTRVVIDLIDPNADEKALKGAKLFFNDQRKFGWVRLLPSTEVPHTDFFKKVGPEPLDSEFTDQIFRERIRRRSKSSVKSALLDQTVLAGVGNIYADESLWGAKIHPATLVGAISTTKLNRLYDELRTILNLAIEKGGSTDRNYVNAEGKKGSYLSFARVFRREGQPCQRCGASITKLRVAGRGTHICHRCQRLSN
jgi:formamidopyrimidine-DNA glycosylase